MKITKIIKKVNTDNPFEETAEVYLELTEQFKKIIIDMVQKEININEWDNINVYVKGIKLKKEVKHTSVLREKKKQ